MIELHRTRSAPEPLSEPVVEAQAVEVRRRADLEDDVALPAAVWRPRRDEIELVRARRDGVHEALDLEVRPVGCRPRRGRAEPFTVGVVTEAQEDAATRPRDHDVIRLVLGDGNAEHRAHVLRPRVAVHREITAADGVEVIEADREGDAELLDDARSEDAGRLVREHHVERDLERGRVAEQDPALGRDELVAESGVRAWVVRAEHVARPSPAPRHRQERGTRPERTRRYGAQGSAERLTIHRSRRGRIARIHVARPSPGERTPMPVLDRPVHEQETPRRPCRAVGLAEIRGAPFFDGAQGESLRQVDVPDSAIARERTAGTEHDREHAILWLDPRGLGREQVLESAVEPRREHRIVAERAALGATDDGFIGREAVSRVDQAMRDVPPSELGAELRHEPSPVERGRSVERDDRRPHAGELVGERAEATSDRVADHRIAWFELVRQPDRG